MLPMIYMALVDDEDLPKFEQLYKNYRQQLYAIAYSILNNEQDAEDAVQTAYINIANPNLLPLASHSRSVLASRGAG